MSLQNNYALPLIHMAVNTLAFMALGNKTACLLYAINSGFNAYKYKDSAKTTSALNGISLILCLTGASKENLIFCFPTLLSLAISGAQNTKQTLIDIKDNSVYANR